MTRFSFKWLVIGSYWFTNVLGLFFMYSEGKYLILSAKSRIKIIVFLLFSIIVCSIMMLYLDKKGKLLPLGVFFEKYCVIK